MQASRTPTGLSPQRAWRWCVARTELDCRHAAARGRPISRFNAKRLIARRWRNTMRSQQIDESGQRY